MVPKEPGSNLDELPTGTTLQQGQFTIETFLSAGGFGITYVARDSLARQVVIKECFPASYCRRTGHRVGTRSRSQAEELRSFVTLFRQEAVNLAKLNHPNIVRVHQVFEENDTAYIAMDYIRGPDLHDTIEGKAPRLAPDRIIHLLHRVLDALGHVHAHGFLHRDIAPDNILLDASSGEPVLIDFGAARKDETRKSRLLSGLRIVKDGYSPQEFYISGSVQAPYSDLYALAATFSHLITGEPPKTSRERLSAVANRQPDPQRPVLGRVSGYPPAFLAAIDKAMSIFPRDRLQSAADWQAMLGDTAPAPARAVSYRQAPALPATPPVAASPLHRDWLVRAAAVSVLIAGLVSAGGDLYDRFWPLQRDSQLLILDLPSGPEPASGGQHRTAEASENPSRFGLDLPAFAGFGGAADLSDAELVLNRTAASALTTADARSGAWIALAAALTPENAGAQVGAIRANTERHLTNSIDYNTLRFSNLDPQPVAIAPALPESTVGQSPGETVQAFGLAIRQSPAVILLDFDENYLNARPT